MVNEATKNAGCRILRAEVVTEINPVWFNGRITVGKILSLGNAWNAQIVEATLDVVRLKEWLTAKELVETRPRYLVTDILYSIPICACAAKTPNYVLGRSAYTIPCTVVFALVFIGMSL